MSILRKISISTIFNTLAVYGFAHLLIDASCYFVLLDVIDFQKALINYILLYNVLAFGLQPILGYLSDRIGRPSIFAFTGCLAICPTFFLSHDPVTVSILCGIGNAMFHIGGGTISLNLRPGKAFYPGIFVAPGGLGLFAGSMLVKNQIHAAYPLTILLLATGIAMLIIRQPVHIRSENKQVRLNQYILAAILLLLITICIRSGVGFSINYPWKTEGLPAVLFVFAVTLGKFTGGYLSDRFGWIRITVSGLIISSLLLFFGEHYVIAGIAGILLFNLSMPVTLTAISNLLPGRSGFAFGLTTLALLIGSIPALIAKKPILSINETSLIVLVSALVLLAGLYIYDKVSNHA